MLKKSLFFVTLLAASAPAFAAAENAITCEFEITSGSAALFKDSATLTIESDKVVSLRRQVPNSVSASVHPVYNFSFDPKTEQASLKVDGSSVGDNGIYGTLPAGGIIEFESFDSWGDDETRVTCKRGGKLKAQVASAIDCTASVYEITNGVPTLREVGTSSSGFPERLATVSFDDSYWSIYQNDNRFNDSFWMIPGEVSDHVMPSFSLSVVLGKPFTMTLEDEKAFTCTAR